MIEGRTDSKLKVFILCCFIFLIFLSINIFAKENNLTDYEIADLCLNESKKIIIEMNESNFSVERMNDVLYDLSIMFEAQSALMRYGKNTDFSLVISHCEDIPKIKELALDATYQFEGLIKFYDAFLEEGMNTTSIDNIISEINAEIISERYEKVPALVEEGYSEITNIKTSNTALKLFYKTTTRGVKDFFIDNWIMFIVSFSVFLVLFFAYRATIRKWIIKEKIRKLKMKREIFNKLIERTQRDYFENGKMSENDYMIKTKKFSEMIRDIDRQIPLLKVDYVKIEKKEDIDDRKADKKMEAEERNVLKKNLKRNKKK